jgi:MFS family permease
LTQTVEVAAEAQSALSRPRWLPHHAWFVAATGAVVYFFQSGMSGYLLGVLQPAWLSEFGWPATWLSVAFGIGSLIPGLAGVHVGRWTDRYGPRWMIIGGAVLLGVSYFSLAWVNGFFLFCVFFGIGSIGRAGMSNVPVSAAIARWFTGRRTLAMGLASTGISLAGVILVPLGTWLILNYGWRPTVVLLGLGVWVVIIPLAYLIMDRSPADRGMRPYGERLKQDPRRLPPGGDATLHEALHDSTFWLISAGQMLGTSTALAIGIHGQKAIIDKGVSPAEAAAAISLFATSALLSRFVYSWIGELVPAAPLLAFTYLMQSVGMLFLALSGPGPGIWLFALTFGFSLGGSVALQSVVVAELFGMRGYGAILGAMQLPSAIFSALSPIIAAAVHDLTGTYAPAFIAFAAMSVCGAISLLSATRRPRRTGSYLTGG